MLGVSRQSIASVGTALAVALLSLTVAKADSASDNKPPNWDEVFAQVVGDQTAVKQNEWRDFSALGYAKPKRSDAAAVPWLPPQQMPAVDGINGKIAGYGGGENGSNGFYGTSGSLSVPLAQQWGLQLDGNLGSDSGIGFYSGAAHLFWRDPSIGLLGAYVSYSRNNGIDSAVLGHIVLRSAAGAWPRCLQTVGSEKVVITARSRGFASTSDSVTSH